MKCSIIILNWNGSQMLQKYLPSAVHYTTNPDYEVIVADNGSNDDSLDILSRQFPTVRRIVLDHNYGFAEGYNKAIEQIDSEYVILLNSDVEVTPQWADILIRHMDTHPDIAAAQPKIRSVNRREYFEHAGAAGGFMDVLGYPYCRGRILNHIEQDWGQYDTVTPVFWASGACMCVRTKIYKELGGLDSDFFAHMEEIDLCWRMNCRGYQLVCIPNSIVYHLGGGSLNYDSPNKTYLNFRNNLLMIYKNGTTRQVWTILAIRWILDNVAALQFLISGRLSHARAVVRARIDFLRLLPAFYPKRQKNIEQTCVAYPNTIIKRSILWDYYVRGKRK